MISHLTMQSTRGLTLPTRTGPSSSSSQPLRDFGEIGLIIGISVIVVSLLALLIKITHCRRKRKRRATSSNLSQRAPHPAPAASSTQRKGRREHRPRKPTLAETGGLPPIRDTTSQSPAN